MRSRKALIALGLLPVAALLFLAASQPQPETYQEMPDGSRYYGLGTSRADSSVRVQVGDTADVLAVWPRRPRVRVRVYARPWLGPWYFGPRVSVGVHVRRRNGRERSVVIQSPRIVYRATE